MTDLSFINDKFRHKANTNGLRFFKEQVPLEYIGNGANRVVFHYSAGFVIKFALWGGGVEENKNEFSLFNTTTSPILAEIDLLNSDTNHWFYIIQKHHDVFNYHDVDYLDKTRQLNKWSLTSGIEEKENYLLQVDEPYCKLFRGVLDLEKIYKTRIADLHVDNIAMSGTDLIIIDYGCIHDIT